MSEAAAKMERALSASRVRLRMNSPFFATLSMLAPFVVNENIPAMATDGRRVHVNPEFLDELNNAELDGVVLHEVLHLALLHVLRRAERDAMRWNIAADIVVNGLVSSVPGVRLPEGTIRDPDLEHLTVEEIYELVDDDLIEQLGMADLLEPAGFEEGEMSRSEQVEIEEFWQDALRQAQAVQNATSAGKRPAAIERLLKDLDREKMDWRKLLWRHLVTTPTDFGSFDRRHAWQGLYLETLVEEPTTLHVAVDTSGSITQDQLRSFLSEVSGIARTYPTLKVRLYYCDAELHGPYELGRGSAPPPPVGGGGTSFLPFFRQMAEVDSGIDQTPCVYLTDGYGAFPMKSPQRPVMWVVPPGGRRDEQFPFGNVVRMVER